MLWDQILAKTCLPKMETIIIFDIASNVMHERKRTKSTLSIEENNQVEKVESIDIAPLVEMICGIVVKPLSKSARITPK